MIYSRSGQLIERAPLCTYGLRRGPGILRDSEQGERDESAGVVHGGVSRQETAWMLSDVHTAGGFTEI